MTSFHLPTFDELFPAAFSRRVAIGGLSAGGLAVAAALTSRGGAKAMRQEAGASPVASPGGATPEATVGYLTVPQVFEFESFNFEFLNVLGGTFEQIADIGEAFAATTGIVDYDFDSWVSSWVSMGDRLRAIGDEADARGRRVSAREAYARASNYYGVAYWFALGTSEPERTPELWEQAYSAFADFLTRLDRPVEAVEIPYEDTTLPGYAVLVDDSGEVRPWVILQNGSDGSNISMWSFGGAAALRRGYNVLFYDGPGQNAALFRQNLHFRPDWEAVITPVVDFLLARPDVNPEQIALYGISQSGYWAPRAATAEHRLAAVIADPGVHNVATSWTRQLPAEMLDALYGASGDDLEEIKQAIDQGVNEMLAQDPIANFTLKFRMYPFGTDSLAEILLQLREYNLDGIAGQIECPILITDPEGEDFWPDQSTELADMIGENATLARFTAEEGADLHCEPKAAGRRNQVIFDWLDDTFGR